MSRPTCASKHTHEAGVPVKILLNFLKCPEENRYHGLEYRVEEPRNLNSFIDAGWTVLDISDNNELPRDNGDSVEVKHRIPVNKMSMAEFITKFEAVIGDCSAKKFINVIIVSEDPDDILEVLPKLAVVERIKGTTIKVLVTDKSRIQ